VLRLQARLFYTYDFPMMRSAPRRGRCSFSTRRRTREMGPTCARGRRCSRSGGAAVVPGRRGRLGAGRQGSRPDGRTERLDGEVDRESSAARWRDEAAGYMDRETPGEDKMRSVGTPAGLDPVGGCAATGGRLSTFSLLFRVLVLFLFIFSFLLFFFCFCFPFFCPLFFSTKAAPARHGSPAVAADALLLAGRPFHQPQRRPRPAPPVAAVTCTTATIRNPPGLRNVYIRDEDHSVSITETRIRLVGKEVAVYVGFDLSLQLHSNPLTLPCRHAPNSRQLPPALPELTGRNTTGSSGSHVSDAPGR